MTSPRSAAPRPPRPSKRRRTPYRAPLIFQDLQVLDLLEISGSQIRAAHCLTMHQTTVSRSYRDLAQQFHLQPRSQPRQACRWGTSTSLRHLRLASRAHRLEAGLLRLATDALHQSLLDGLPGLQLVPPHFHNATDWATLIAQGVIDGAIVSSLCHHEPLSPARLPHWPEVQVILLGQLSLQLVCRGPSAPNGHGPWTGQLLLPRQQDMPLLHQQLAALPYPEARPPCRHQEPQDWLAQMHNSPVAIPVCPGLAPLGWWHEQGLNALPKQPPLRERLWLLLPAGLELEQPALVTLRAIRRRLSRAIAREAAALLELRQPPEPEPPGGGPGLAGSP